jgi:membrane protein required for colicin V production
MNYLDIIILVILGFSVITGFINGLVKEVASLAALIFGIWGAIKFSGFTSAKLYEYFDMSGQYIGIISFIVTFIIIVLVIHFMGTLIDKLMEAIALGFLNKLLGTVFGLLKATLILSVVFVVLNSIDARRPFLPQEKIEESMLYNPISDIAPALFPIIGEGNLFHSFDRLKKEPAKVTI